MDYPWKIGTITPCVRPAGHSTTRHAGASLPALSALSGSRTRDSISWRCRASPPDKEVLHSFCPPATRVYLRSLLCSRYIWAHRLPPVCPHHRRPRGLQACRLTTGHPVFCASPFGLPGVSSTQRWGEGFDPASNGSCPGTWPGRACSSPLTFTSTGRPQGFPVSQST